MVRLRPMFIDELNRGRSGFGRMGGFKLGGNDNRSRKLGSGGG